MKLVLAAQPNNRACLATDFSTYAREGATGAIVCHDEASSFGQVNASLAHVINDLGAPIPSHLAGATSDVRRPRQLQRLAEVPGVDEA